MRVADESGIVEAINGNVSETSPAVAKMEDLLVEDGNVTLTIRLIMQGKVSVFIIRVNSQNVHPRKRDDKRIIGIFFIPGIMTMIIHHEI